MKCEHMFEQTTMFGRVPLISFPVFLAGMVSCDGGCKEAAECEGDGEPTGMVAVVCGVIAFGSGLVVVAVIELAARRFAVEAHADSSSPPKVRIDTTA